MVDGHRSISTEAIFTSVNHWSTNVNHVNCRLTNCLWPLLFVRGLMMARGRKTAIVQRNALPEMTRSLSDCVNGETLMQSFGLYAGCKGSRNLTALSRGGPAVGARYHPTWNHSAKTVLVSGVEHRRRQSTAANATVNIVPHHCDIPPTRCSLGASLPPTGPCGQRLQRKSSFRNQNNGPSEPSLLGRFCLQDAISLQVAALLHAALDLAVANYWPAAQHGKNRPTQNFQPLVRCIVSSVV